MYQSSQSNEIIPSGPVSEYEQVLCAALLHDIGKFYQRAHGEYKPHPEYSAAFVKYYASALPNSELLEKLVKHHHEGQDSPYPPRELSDTRERMLAYLISRADNYSSSERPADVQKSKGVNVRAPLDSLFSQVCIGNLPEEKYQGQLAQHRYIYDLGRAFDAEMYPREDTPGEMLDQYAFETHERRFREEFETYFHAPYTGWLIRCCIC